MSDLTETKTAQNKTFKAISKTIVYGFALFGVLFILILVGVLSLLNPSAKLLPVPDRAILQIDFDQTYAETRQDDFLAELTDQSVYSVLDLVRGIYHAADDPKILALEMNINDTSLELAQIQNIGAALEFFKAQGKKVYAFSSGMGSFGGGNTEYYLASFADEIRLQPNSDIGLTGIEIEVPFFAKLFQKVGIQPEFYTRYEYKTAVSSLVNSEMTPSYREELDKLGKGLYDQIIAQVSKARGLSADEVKKIIDNAPVLTENALEYGLIDKIGYRQTLTRELEREYDAKPINMQDYMGHFKDSVTESNPQIAYLVLEGVINDGKSSETPIYETSIGSQTVLEQLEELKQKENLKALIVRVNSPGGSYTASDEIRFALENFKEEKHVPLIVSMGSYAASGGYFISLPADWIIAEPSTLTGSIGVLGGKFVLAELWKKLDVSWGKVQFGNNADILTSNRPFTPAQQKKFNQSLDRIYRDFTTKTAESRHIDLKDMDQIARGRVWLGEDALKIHLVDSLGGMNEAVAKALELAQMNPDDDYDLLYYPRPRNFQEKLTAFFENTGGLSSAKILEKTGLNASTLQPLFRLNFDAVLPPFTLVY
jgi:protease-4